MRKVSPPPGGAPSAIARRAIRTFPHSGHGFPAEPSAGGLCRAAVRYCRTVSDAIAVGRFELSAPQLRVLGCLLEKQKTTPDVYPLSLNSLRLACNQSTNRDPVVDYDEEQIRDALHRLERRGLTRLASGAGSRSAKYRHLLAEALPMDDAEQAVMCVLMLRGPQTPGELKQRADRMHPFGELEDVNRTLERLIERGLAARLMRRPGQKEERYAHLLGAEEDEAGEGGQSTRQASNHETNGTPSAHDGAAATALEERIAALERRVAALEARSPSPFAQAGAER